LRCGRFFRSLQKCGYEMKGLTGGTGYSTEPFKGSQEREITRKKPYSTEEGRVTKTKDRRALTLLLPFTRRDRVTKKRREKGDRWGSLCGNLERNNLNGKISEEIGSW